MEGPSGECVEDACLLQLQQRLVHALKQGDYVLAQRCASRARALQPDNELLQAVERSLGERLNLLEGEAGEGGDEDDGSSGCSSGYGSGSEDESDGSGGDDESEAGSEKGNDDADSEGTAAGGDGGDEELGGGGSEAGSGGDAAVQEPRGAASEADGRAPGAASSTSTTAQMPAFAKALPEQPEPANSALLPPPPPAQLRLDAGSSFATSREQRAALRQRLQDELEALRLQQTVAQLAVLDPLLGGA